MFSCKTNKRKSSNVPDSCPLLRHRLSQAISREICRNSSSVRNRRPRQNFFEKLHVACDVAFLDTLVFGLSSVSRKLGELSVIAIIFVLAGGGGVVGVRVRCG